MKIKKKEFRFAKFANSYLVIAVFFGVILYFSFLTVDLYPLLINANSRLLKTEGRVYISERNEGNNVNIISTSSDRRYQKEFYNKLDEGEEMIVFKKSDEPVIEKKEPDIIRSMSFFRKIKQNFELWWGNTLNY